MAKNNLTIGSYAKCQYGDSRDTTGSITNVPVQIIDMSSDGKYFLVKKEGLEHYGRAIAKEFLSKAMLPRVSNPLYCSVSVYGKRRTDAAAILGF